MLGDVDVDESDVEFDVADVVGVDVCELGELSVVLLDDGPVVVDDAFISKVKAKTARTVTDLVANILEDTKCVTEETINNSHKKNFTTETLKTVIVKILKMLGSCSSKTTSKRPV